MKGERDQLGEVQTSDLGTSKLKTLMGPGGQEMIQVLYVLQGS